MTNRALPMLALVVAIAIFFGYVQPTWSGPIAAARTAIQNNDDALAAAQAYLERQDELVAARRAIDTDDLARLATFLPDSVDNVGIILDLDALAARSGLSLSNIDVAQAAEAPVLAEGQDLSPVGSVDLSLTAIGTYASLQNFLRGVERSGRLLDVVDLAVKGSHTGAYEYQMTLRLYWLR